MSKKNLVIAALLCSVTTTTFTSDWRAYIGLSASKAKATTEPVAQVSATPETKQESAPVIAPAQAPVALTKQEAAQAPATLTTQTPAKAKHVKTQAPIIVNVHTNEPAAQPAATPVSREFQGPDKNVDAAKARICRDRIETARLLFNQYNDNYRTPFVELQDHENLIERLETKATAAHVKSLLLSRRTPLFILTNGAASAACFTGSYLKYFGITAKSLADAKMAAFVIDSAARSAEINANPSSTPTAASDSLLASAGNFIAKKLVESPISCTVFTLAGAYFAWRSADNVMDFLDWMDDIENTKLHEESKNTIKHLINTETRAELKKDHTPQVENILKALGSAKQYLPHVTKAEQAEFSAKEADILEQLKEAGYAKKA